jgi:hypothetical protein
VAKRRNSLAKKELAQQSQFSSFVGINSAQNLRMTAELKIAPENLYCLHF